MEKRGRKPSLSLSETRVAQQDKIRSVLAVIDRGGPYGRIAEKGDDEEEEPTPLPGDAEEQARAMFCRLLTYFADHAETAGSRRNEGILPPRDEEAWPRPPLALLGEKPKVRADVGKITSGALTHDDFYGPEKDPIAECAMQVLLTPWWEAPNVVDPKAVTYNKAALDYKRGYEHALWDLDPGHTAAVYWPPHVALSEGKPVVRDVLILEITYIRLDGRLQGKGVGPDYIARLQRLAMVEGYNVLIAHWVHQPFARSAYCAFGWLDYDFNRDTLAQPLRPRRTWDAFFPPALLDKERVPIGMWHLTWSPPSVRLWARLTGLGVNDPVLLRLAAVIQDWVATPDPADSPEAKRFHWHSDDYEVLLFLVAKNAVGARIHGIPDDRFLPSKPFYSERVLHVRNTRVPQGDRLRTRLLNAFFVELGRALLMSVTWDVAYGAEEEEDLLDVASPGVFTYPTWQPGLGAWPYILHYEAHPDYEPTNRLAGERPHHDAGDILSGESDEDEPIVYAPPSSQPTGANRDIYLFRMEIASKEEVTIEMNGLRPRPRYELVNPRHDLYVRQSPRRRRRNAPRDEAMFEDYPTPQRERPPPEEGEERPAKRVRTECILCGAELTGESGVQTCGALGCTLYYSTVASL
jgi:GNAT superfamily N-acetyltransferase